MYDVSFEKRKRIVLIGFAAILLVLAVWITMPWIHADSDWKMNYENFKKEAGEELELGMYQRINGIFGSNADREIKIARIRAKSALFSFQEMMVGLGVLMVIVASFLTLFRELQRGDGGLDVWTKSAVVMGMGIIIVTNYLDIVDTAEKLGNIFVRAGADVVATGSEDKSLKDWIDSTFDYGDEDLKGSVIEIDIRKPLAGVPEIISDLGIIFKTIWKYIRLIGLVVVVNLALLPGHIALYSIWLEMLIRRAFFPVAIADIVGQGGRSPGVSYIKKYVSLYIRVAMCYIIAAIGNVLIGQIATKIPTSTFNGAMQLFTIAVLYLSVSRLYSQTSTIANQVVGV